MKELKKCIDKLNEVYSNIHDFQEEKTIRFQQTCYPKFRGKKTYSKWRILLDESKTRYCIRSYGGFKIIDKGVDDLIVIAPIGTKDLLLSKNIADRDVAEQILNLLCL